MTLDKGVFTSGDPKRIAASLKRSAERSRRRKAAPYRSALSMLTFYINRAGKSLPARRKRILMQAKDELRKPGPRDLLAEARLLRLGKRLATGEVTIRSDGEEEPVAHVTATYSIPPQDS